MNEFWWYNEHAACKYMLFHGKSSSESQSLHVYTLYFSWTHVWWTNLVQLWPIHMYELRRVGFCVNLTWHAPHSDWIDRQERLKYQELCRPASWCIDPSYYRVFHMLWQLAGSFFSIFTSFTAFNKFSKSLMPRSVLRARRDAMLQKQTLFNIKRLEMTWIDNSEHDTIVQNDWTENYEFSILHVFKFANLHIECRFDEPKKKFYAIWMVQNSLWIMKIHLICDKKRTYLLMLLKNLQLFWTHTNFNFL